MACESGAKIAGRNGWARHEQTVWHAQTRLGVGKAYHLQTSPSAADRFEGVTCHRCWVPESGNWGILLDLALAFTESETNSLNDKLCGIAKQTLFAARGALLRVLVARARDCWGRILVWQCIKSCSGKAAATGGSWHVAIAGLSPVSIFLM